MSKSSSSTGSPLVPSMVMVPHPPEQAHIHDGDALPVVIAIAWRKPTIASAVGEHCRAGTMAAVRLHPKLPLKNFLTVLKPGDIFVVVLMTIHCAWTEVCVSIKQLNTKTECNVACLIRLGLEWRGIGIPFWVPCPVVAGSRRLGI